MYITSIIIFGSVMFIIINIIIINNNINNNLVIEYIENDIEDNFDENIFIEEEIIIVDIDNYELEIIKFDNTAKYIGNNNNNNLCITYKYNGNKTQCSICLEDIIKNDDIKQLNCLHFYHDYCLDKWLNIKKRCPLCNLKLE